MNLIRNALTFLLVVIPLSAYCQVDRFSYYFATGRSQLESEQIARLDSLLYSGQLAGSVNIRITGYADEPGTAAINKTLARQRAASVRAYLIASGMKGEQILSCTGVGNRQRTGEDAGQRRADLEVLRVEKPSVDIPPPVSTLPAPDSGLQALGRLKKNDIVEIKGLLFNVSSSIISKPSYPVLDQLVQVLKDFPTVEIRVEGHICCGSAPGSSTKMDSWYRLSEARAKAVMSYLIAHEIPESRLSYKGLGFSRPRIYPERNPADENLNRRVEIRVISN